MVPNVLFDSMQLLWLILCCLHMSICLFVGSIPFSWQNYWGVAYREEREGGNTESAS